MGIVVCCKCCTYLLCVLNLLVDCFCIQIHWIEILNTVFHRKCFHLNEYCLDSEFGFFPSVHSLLFMLLCWCCRCRYFILERLPMLLLCIFFNIILNLPQLQTSNIERAFKWLKTLRRFIGVYFSLYYLVYAVRCGWPTAFIV